MTEFFKFSSVKSMLIGILAIYNLVLFFYFTVIVELFLIHCAMMRAKYYPEIGTLLG